MMTLDRLTPFLPHRSVRARFAWATGISGVLFAVLLAFWMAHDQRQQLDEAVSASVRREARVMGQIVSSALSERQQEIQQLASSPEVASGLIDAGAMRLLLERVRSNHPEFEWLALVDAKGMVSTATGARLERQDLSGQAWFAAALRAPWVGRPQAAGPLAPFLPVDEDGGPVRLIDMAVPVIDYEGRTIGVIVGMLNWRWIREMYNTLILQDDSLQNILLQTSAGEVVIGPVPLLGQRLQPAGLDKVRAGAAQVLSWPDIGPQLTAVAPVRWSEQQGQEPWIMVLRQDPRLAYGWADQLWQRTLLVGLLASGVFMCISWWLAGRLVRPLRTLAETAVALREGQPAHFDVSPQQADEIAALSQSLHDMHTRLQMRMAELATYRDHLEDTVTQRTEQLRLARDKAEAATSAKSAFIANMSHEIRTPMNAIIGMTYLMQRGPLHPGQAERLHTVHEAAAHLLDIINNILDLSKIEAGMFTLSEADFDLPALLNKAVDMVAGKAREKQLKLSVDHTGCPQRLRGDATRLSQILINLLSNAVKFTERGQIRLAVHQLAQTEQGVNLRIEVHDTGAGIPSDKVGKLFNAFVQADDSTTRRFGGTGLGLAISRSLVELMGGQIGVDSQVGRGSVFWCTLWLQPALMPDVTPLAPDEIGLTPEQAAALIKRDHAGARVLLAEDNPINSMLAMELLAMVDMAVIQAANGAQALDLVRRLPFDLVLMDVHMPEMDGLQATRQIRQLPQGRDLPIIAMTASVLQDEREACLDAGMNGHLAKPIDTQALFQTLLRALQQRQQAPMAAQPAPQGLSNKV